MKLKKHTKLSLSTKIFIALVCGIITGLFFGEMTAFLEIIGEIYIKLLQMTVLPYVILSLIVGLGSLEYKQAILLAKKGGLLLLVIWAITIGVVFLFPLAFPDWQFSSFFSGVLIEPKEPVDFVKLYIPANPFNSIANNLVPAVVIFCISIGVALIGIKEKASLIEDMNVLMDALTKVTNFIVRLTPIGVFAITASASGTMGIGELRRMEVYLFTYVFFSLAMSLWILPALVTTLTPLKYRQVVWLTKDALVTAFATSSLFVVLPILAEKSKEMVSQSDIDQNSAESAIAVIIPTSFNFPHAGKLFTISFILFAGWFSGFDVEPADYPLLLGSGLMSLFANVNIAVPFLLDTLQIPSDTFHFFVATSVINARFATLLAAVHVLSLTLLTAFSMNDQLKIHWFKLFRYIVVSCCLLFTVVTGTRLILTATIEYSYDKDTLLASMPLSRQRVVGKVHTEPPEPLDINHSENRLKTIIERGVLRVCYPEDNNMPFTYFNSKNQLVGFEIELFQVLSADLNVKLEFVPASGDDLSSYFNEGYCDMGTGQSLTPLLSTRQGYTTPHIDYTVAFLVKDHRRHQFNNYDTLRQQDLEIATVGTLYYRRMLHDMLPKAELLFVDSLSSYIEHYSDKADAFATFAEKASAWSILHPEYAVATPLGNSIKIPVAYPIPLGEESMADLLNNWLNLKQKDGTISSLYNYWILGETEKKHSPRWSIIRDVLHWI
ncbi:cation:dicarboxylate symporter family transporter [Desulfopila sp. IMCC35008]|uniref:cation:dicarboxylate symporter family transporter n=1 Tax=Desulfopila sp. IMCC35008 TaxID=2653858 RepID=UPI0013D5086D|nr:cation:dicarboxylase symporter family transporter [Desulfopila sp. IMCC35008]